MRQMFVLLVIVLFGIAACQQSEADNGATAEPTIEIVQTPTPANPRIQETPTSSLPPTWTPSAGGSGGGFSPGNDDGLTAVDNGSTQPTIEEGAVVYTIQPGDSLGAIAEKYDVSLQALADANNISDWDRIEIGDVLIIPQ